MTDVKIVGGPEIMERTIPDEEKFLEITWELNIIPKEEWDKEFEKEIKKHLEKENEFFGPYKPKIIFTQLILTISDKNNIEKQKEYYEDKFILKVNAKFS
ncbi:MAG: hypothetical protein ACE5RF_03480 [Nitrosarchaeum sp.]